MRIPLKNFFDPTKKPFDSFQHYFRLKCCYIAKQQQEQQRNERHIVQEIVFLMALSYNKKVKEPAFDSLGEANNMEIAAILQPGSG